MGDAWFVKLKAIDIAGPRFSSTNLGLTNEKTACFLTYYQHS